MSLNRRRTGPELMDRPDARPEDLARSLLDLAAVNRWLGGTRAVLRALDPILHDTRPMRVLDIATGAADIPLAIARWARARGGAVEVVAADLHPRTLRVAQAATAPDPAVTVVGADALALPFAAGAFDVAVCSTALHHFSEEEAVRVLREMRRVASDAVVVQDLRRSPAALAGVELLARTVWRRHPITRHDGPVSIRAAFTGGELRALAARAGLTGAVVTRAPLFRLLLVHRAGGR